jgi:hypothetical protein
MAKKVFDYRDFVPIVVGGKRYIPQAIYKTASEAKTAVASLKRIGYKAKVNKCEYNVGIRYLVYFIPAHTKDYRAPGSIR